MVGDDHPALWNDDRNTLYELLKDLDPELAGLYSQMIVLLSDPAVPGQEKSRLASIGHCLRELINTLPDALGDVEGFPINRGKSDRSAREALVAEYEAISGPPVEHVTVDEVDETGQPRLIAVPQSLLDAVGRLVTTINDGKAREEQRDSTVVLGRIDSRDPALKPWKAARKFFMHYAHFDRDYPLSPEPRDLPSDADILVHLENIEASLHTRLGAFFDNYDELQDLIAKANETIDKDESA